jgi:hypothetical protein
MVQSQPGQIVHETLSRKNPLQRRAGGVAQGVGTECKPQYCKKKKKRRKLAQNLHELFFQKLSRREYFPMRPVSP